MAFAAAHLATHGGWLSRCVGACAATLMPLYELIKAHVFAAQRIHGDDTTVPVLAKIKTRTGRLWTYVRDDQPFGGRGRIHPQQNGTRS